MAELPPLAIYIHWPYCTRICPYCDFNSHAFERSFPEKNYIDALLDDLRIDQPYAQGRMLQSIFIGGGTPSLFSPSSLAYLLHEIKAMIPFVEDAEITLEAGTEYVELGATAQDLSENLDIINKYMYLLKILT